jgi:transcriptional regulator with XRE-family HTH domain
MSLTPDQCRAARAQTGLSQKQLAERASVALKTLSDFETGKTSPRAKTRQTLKDALEATGAIFTSEDKAGIETRGVSVSASSFVDATDLKLWAARSVFHGLLPELVRRLISAGDPSPHTIDFPKADSAQVGGWDGIVEGATATQFVPGGLSGWEMGCDANPTTKANKDYVKRTKNSLGFKKDQTTFVFVTPRLWAGKKKWLTEKRAQSPWLDIRALGADDLELWLSCHPGIAVWLSIQMEKLPPDVETLEEFWQVWQLRTKRTLHPSIVLSGRDAAKEQVKQWMDGAPQPLFVKAETADEATAFLAALTLEDVAPPLCLRLNRKEAVRTVGGRTSKMIIVAPEGGGEVAEQASALGHHVYIPLGDGEFTPQDREIVRLPMVSREDFETALQASGFSETESERLRKDSVRSLAVLQRQLGATGMPPWTRPEHARALIPILLAGKWADHMDGDKEAIAKIAGKDYGDVIDDLTRWRLQSDPPVILVDGMWRLKAPREAWLMLGRYLTPSDIDRLKEVVLDVLGEADPALDMKAEDRWLANVRGKTMKYSGALREGLVNALILLAVLGDEAGISAVGAPQRWVYHIVRTLLRDADAQRWYALSSLLRYLAEASPDAFLEAIEESLRQSEPPLAILFKNEPSTYGFGGSHHSDLLWGLEGLAWDAAYLTRVTLILGDLNRFELPANLGNHPRNSLKEIHLLWREHTHATFAQRMIAVDRLLSTHLTAGWQLLIDLHPSGSDVSSGTYQMRWRSTSAPNPLPITEDNWFLRAQEVRARLLREAGKNVKRWQDIIGEVPAFTNAQKVEAIERLADLCDGGIDEDDRLALANTVRKFVARHRSFPEAKWSMSKDDGDSFAKLYERIAPKDPLFKNRWLFDDRWIELTKGTRRTDDEAMKAARLKALNEIQALHGVDGFFSLAQLAKDSRLVGETVGALLEPSETDWTLIRDGLSSTPEHVSFVRGLISHRAFGNDISWIERMLEHFRAESVTDAMLVNFFLSISCERASWDLMAEFGSVVHHDYWFQMNPYATREETDFTYAIERLLEVNRPKSAMEIASFRRRAVPSRTKVAILTTLAERPTAEEGQIDSYTITRLFESLDKAADVDEATMIELEWAYAAVLSGIGSERKTTLIHKRLAENPADFVQFVKFVYKNESEDSKEDSSLTKEQIQQRASRAYDVLKSWRTVPGTSTNGKVDFNALWQWIEVARDQSIANGRIIGFESQLGHIFAYALEDDDGFWPDTGVCEAIELLGNPNVDNSFNIGVHNKRGTVTKAYNEGGAQERKLGEHFRRQAEERTGRYPRTASILRDIADSYMDEGARADEQAQRRDLED